jgi:hypothetical protein
LFCNSIVITVADEWERGMTAGPASLLLMVSDGGIL